VLACALLFCGCVFSWPMVFATGADILISSQEVISSCNSI
jgi:hypothetical protein